MAFTAPTELLDWLSQNLLLNADQTQQLRVWSTQAGPDLHGLCKELLRRDWLTPFQINQIIKHDGDTLVIGANRLYAKIGEGAMGQVYKAWNVRLGRMVAVKMLHPDHAVNGKAMDRFRREMQTAAALDHPNIVLLRDADERHGVPYLVMDFFDGIDLSKKVRTEGPQPIGPAVEWIRQAALGLQHAYARGIVHRDIKPSNLLLVRTADGRSTIKILDFGLAKFERETSGDQPLTQAGRLIGTVDFIAPEQALDAHNADVRADIYSLGCTLYYLLTGKAPFLGNDHLDKLSARLQNDPPRLRDLRPDAPAGLEDVILKLMARDPAQRYQTPQDAAAALAPFSSEALATALAPTVAMAMPVVPALPDRTPQIDVEQVDVEPDPFAYANEATFTPDDDPESRPEPRSRRRPDSDDRPRQGSSGKFWALVIGGIAVLLILVGGGVTAIVFWSRKTPAVDAPPVAQGTMTIALDSPPDKVWAYGEQKPIIVKVNRQNFTGIVKLSVEPCPDWLMCRPGEVGVRDGAGQLYLRPKFGGHLGPATVTIVASSVNSQPASVEYQMEVVAMRAKKFVPPPEKEPVKKDEPKDPAGD